MDIERVNEHTLKFFISYVDMEERGFDREEIWYNRERGEELFWDMMDEAHHLESFPIEGPLWIQVQALEKGLEITVTKAQISKDGTKLELPITKDKHIDISLMPETETLVGPTDDDDEDEEEGELSFLLKFSDFEDLIDLSFRMEDAILKTELYHYNDHYYLYVVFDKDATDYECENDISQMLEFGSESGLTEHVLQEYGKLILSGNVFQEIRKYFGH
ncbi:adaptor protein MecA [Tuberibacillus calidus]|uniref:adaptor protein MecA n=1 Tax=Tuberibacillus calidus TaxID=340097 RepID=UPI0003FBCCE3|nr:adaptor protein MecA [Tuberibacillus calidus]